MEKLNYLLKDYFLLLQFCILNLTRTFHVFRWSYHKISSFVRKLKNHSCISLFSIKTTTEKVGRTVDMKIIFIEYWNYFEIKIFVSNIFSSFPLVTGYLKFKGNSLQNYGKRPDEMRSCNKGWENDIKETFQSLKYEIIPSDHEKWIAFKWCIETPQSQIHVQFLQFLQQ